MTTPQDIAQAMEGCLDIIRRYAPSTTSGNPPIPDSQRLRNVADTLYDAADAIDRGTALTPEAPTEPDEIPDITEPEDGLEESAPNASPF